MEKDVEDDVKEPLLLLFVYSVLLGALIRGVPDYLHKQSVTNNNVSLISVENIGLVVAFTLIYLAFKKKEFLKLIYFIGSVPFILMSRIVQMINIDILYYLNIAITFSLSILLIKYLGKKYTDVSYKK